MCGLVFPPRPVRETMVVATVPIQSITVVYHITLHPFAPLVVIYTVLSCIIVSESSCFPSSPGITTIIEQAGSERGP